MCLIVKNGLPYVLHRKYGRYGVRGFQVNLLGSETYRFTGKHMTGFDVFSTT